MIIWILPNMVYSYAAILCYFILYIDVSPYLGIIVIILGSVTIPLFFLFNILALVLIFIVSLFYFLYIASFCRKDRFDCDWRGLEQSFIFCVKKYWNANDSYYSNLVKYHEQEYNGFMLNKIQLFKIIYYLFNTIVLLLLTIVISICIHFSTYIFIVCNAIKLYYDKMKPNYMCNYITDFLLIPIQLLMFVGIIIFSIIFPFISLFCHLLHIPEIIYISLHQAYEKNDIYEGYCLTYTNIVETWQKINGYGIHEEQKSLIKDKSTNIELIINTGTDICPITDTDICPITDTDICPITDTNICPITDICSITDTDICPITDTQQLEE